MVHSYVFGHVTKNRGHKCRDGNGADWACYRILRMPSFLDQWIGYCFDVTTETWDYQCRFNHGEGLSDFVKKNKDVENMVHKLLNRCEGKYRSPCPDCSRTSTKPDGENVPLPVRTDSEKTAWEFLCRCLNDLEVDVEFRFDMIDSDKVPSYRKKDNYSCLGFLERVSTLVCQRKQENGIEVTVTMERVNHQRFTLTMECSSNKEEIKYKELKIFRCACKVKKGEEEKEGEQDQEQKKPQEKKKPNKKAEEFFKVEGEKIKEFLGVHVLGLMPFHHEYSEITVTVGGEQGKL